MTLTESLFQVANHSVDVTLDRAKLAAAFTMIDACRAALAQHNFKRHRFTITERGLVISPVSRLWFEVRNSERNDASSTVRTLGAELDQFEINFPDVFRRMIGITL